MQRDAAQALLTFVRARLVQDPDAAIGPDTALFEEGWIDSITILDLIGYVERRLGRRLEDHEIVAARFRSVQAITNTFFHA